MKKYTLLLETLDQKATIFFKYSIVTFFSLATLIYTIDVLLGLDFIRENIYSGGNLWMGPLVNYLFVLASLMGAAYGVRTGENIKIELFHKFAKQPAVRLILNTTAMIASIFIVAVFMMDMIRALPFEELSTYLDSANQIGGGFFTKLGKGFIMLFSHAELSEFKIPRWILNIPYILLFGLSFFYYFLLALRAATEKENNSEL